MKKTLPLLSALAVYMTIVVSLCNLFLFFSYLQTGKIEYIELWPWLLLSLGTFGFIRLFLREERTIPQVVILGAFCYVITLVVMNLFFVYVTSITSRLFVFGFLGITTLMGCNINLEEYKTSNLLLCCELPVIGIGILLLMSHGGFLYYPTYFGICTVGILIFSIIALTISKMENNGVAQDGKKHIALGTICSCFLIMGGLATAFVYFASNLASHTVSKASEIIMSAIQGVLQVAKAIFEWILSLFPTPENINMEILPPEPAMTLTEDMAMQDMDYSHLLMFVVGLLILGVIALIVWVLYHFRKTKIKGSLQTTSYHRPKVVREKSSFWIMILEFWKRKWGVVVLQIKIFRYRNTPKGAPLYLAQMGKKKGIEKQVGESYPAYLLRLEQLCQPIDGKASSLLLELTQIVNISLYAPRMEKSTLEKKDFRQIRSVVRKIK